MDFVGGIGWDRKMRTDSPFQRAKTGNSNEGGNLMGVRTRGATLGSKLPSHDSRFKNQNSTGRKRPGGGSALDVAHPVAHLYFVRDVTLRLDLAIDDSEFGADAGFRAGGTQ